MHQLREIWKLDKRNATEPSKPQKLQTRYQTTLSSMGKSALMQDHFHTTRLGMTFLDMSNLICIHT